MSRGHSQPKTLSGRRMLDKCKEKGKSDNVIIIDVDQGQSSNVIMIDAPESSQQRQRDTGKLRSKKFSTKVIISIDDEEDGDGLHSDAASNQKSHSGSSQSHLSEESDSDDCQIFDQERNFPFKLSNHRQMYPRNGSFGYRFGLDTDSEASSPESEGSDCELMEGSCGGIREQWEKAALKKKMSEDVCNHQSGSEDHVSASESNANDRNDCHEAMHSEMEQSRDASVHSSSSTAISENDNASTCTAASVPEGKNAASDSDQTVDQISCKRYGFKDRKKQVLEVHSFSDTQFWDDAHVEYVNYGKASSQNQKESGPESCSTTAKLHEETHVHGGSALWEKGDDVHRCNGQPQPPMHVDIDRLGFEGKEEAASADPSLCNQEPQEDTRINSEMESIQSEQKQVLQKTSAHRAQPCNGIPEGSCTAGSSNDDTIGFGSSLIGEREKHKETDEYKRAMEEEWALRHRQLQIQAEEAQRLRKKRKAENLRLLDMERRQKLRLQEVREYQKKDEETINLKEQLRIEVRKELEKLQLECRDMASLLRALGILVEGGLYPLPHEVNAAYKRALLRFHPDRASRYDIRQQVEAEEKFKLISHLKEKLVQQAQ